MFPYRSPSVFNFYGSTYQPLGPIRSMGLSAPEGELGTGPFLLGLLNGLKSLAQFGLTQCWSGFGSGITLSHPDGEQADCRTTGASRADAILRFRPSDSQDAHRTVAELDLLLTQGSMNSHNKQVIEGVYAQTAALSGNVAVQGSSAALPGAFTNQHHGLALEKALLLFFASAEFHATNKNVRLGSLRPAPRVVPSRGRPYKAIVVLFQSGGADSWNLVVPHSGCGGAVGEPDLHDAYQLARAAGTDADGLPNEAGSAALDKDRLLQIPVPIPARSSEESTPQPCDTFGVHPSMPSLKAMYDSGEAAFLANVGTLIKPLTKEEFNTNKPGTIPESVFAHNIQVETTQHVHAGAGKLKTKGVLGRMLEALQAQEAPYSASSYSLDGNVKILDGTLPANILTIKGVTRLSGVATYEDAIANMTRAVGGSIFAETFNNLLESSINKTEKLGTVLADKSYDLTEFKRGGDKLMQQFEQVAKVMKANADPASGLQNEREAFFVNIGGFDTHADLEGTVSGLFSSIDNALASFKAEMEAQGLWDNVAVVSASDFGRTLRSNGAGTDHAWGGHYFVVGGKVQGGQILGSYPDRLDDNGPLSVRGGGRFIPSTSWEAVWHGLAEWFGVEEARMEKVLPNIANFAPEQRFSKERMFEE